MSFLFFYFTRLSPKFEYPDWVKLTHCIELWVIEQWVKCERVSDTSLVYPVRTETLVLTYVTVFHSCTFAAC